MSLPPKSDTSNMEVSVPGALAITLCDEQVILLPQKAMFWPKHSTLFLADAHFGKAGTFRSHKIAIPSGITETDLSKIDFLVEQLSVQKIIFLGDFIHATTGITRRISEQMSRWRTTHRNLSICLIKGNHDRSVKSIADKLEIELLNEPYSMAPFWLCHHPDIKLKDPGFVLCGHLHPAVRLFGQGKQKVRLPCFFIQDNQAILPAFGSFTGCMEIEPGANEGVFVIAENEVIRASRQI
ncbi:MAG: ligase-associated DNA damage response endonuclease PdeM [Cyanobacteria bacterium TGS_CYA1]|nr:ligase-associated DNA damage response endonuclease PdeM [Cyanobacteria bacterium TGS_CYA1]